MLRARAGPQRAASLASLRHPAEGAAAVLIVGGSSAIGLPPAVNGSAPEVTHRPPSHDSLAKVSFMAPLDHKETRK